MADEGGPDFAVDVELAHVEAIGEPGQRRFRVLTRASGETTIMWMEKQQVDALGRAIEQILEQAPLPFEEQTLETATAVGIDSESFNLETRNQFRVGKIELGYDQERDRLVVVAYDVDSEEDDAPSLAALVPRELARHMADESAAVVAAGRPRCVLCGVPMGPGPHACPQQNGHLIHEF
jgi:uncharacterized repeat protein (TIGR03847 family)